MISQTTRRPHAASPKRRALRQISKLREEIEDLHDYLDLLEARALHRGKRGYTIAEVRKRLQLD